MIDKMIKICLLATMIMQSCYGKTTECHQKNISCPDIKITEGFKFAFAFPGGREISEISVYDNKTLIAHAAPRKQQCDHLPDVVSMDNGSVVTRHCRDLRVQCIFFDGQHVAEHCVEYDTTAEKTKTSDLQTPWGLNIGVSVAVLCAVLLIVVLWWCFKKKQNCVASLLGFFRHLLSCSCHRGGVSQAERGEREENGNDSTANGRTPQTLSLDHSLNDVGIELTKNGDLSAPDVNRASNHRTMNRNVRDDPGGVNDTRGQFTVRSSERHESQDHVNEGQPLLPNERAAVQDFDMTAVALVNKHGFHPDQVSRCSTVLDTDVESMSSNMKNHNIHK
ncbi:uncharacterized protein LOC122966098 isoform X1 [Thunnus albacares]|uniref:uncharacterized protein LOC122966098 isoform X1 n=2 Tax=Thunnus albacares TaxID=8236 RepID=UPI001CF695DE|nr:uncharacterized protein LOC122966098 isoform X1 [Thunnus albacares]